MGCLRVKKLNEYLGEPLKHALQDPDPYVRKTAVLCVIKVYEVSKEVIEKDGIIRLMQDMVETEGNALVIANLLQSLFELSAQQIENERMIQAWLQQINDVMNGITSKERRRITMKRFHGP